MTSPGSNKVPFNAPQARDITALDTQLVEHPTARYRAVFADAMRVAHAGSRRVVAVARSAALARRRCWTQLLRIAQTTPSIVRRGAQAAVDAFVASVAVADAGAPVAIAVLLAEAVVCIVDRADHARTNLPLRHVAPFLRLRCRRWRSGVYALANPVLRSIDDAHESRRVRRKPLVPIAGWIEDLKASDDAKPQHNADAVGTLPTGSSMFKRVMLWWAVGS